jgi:hypothetical protein
LLYHDSGRRGWYVESVTRWNRPEVYTASGQYAG